MLPNGPWVAYERWPSPPKTPIEEYGERIRSLYICHYNRHRDSRAELKDSIKSCWFLCRYGMQSYRDVVDWPVSDINMGLQSLSEYIKMESPNPRSGPS